MRGNGGEKRREGQSFNTESFSGVMNDDDESIILKSLTRTGYISSLGKFSWEGPGSDC